MSISQRRYVIDNKSKRKTVVLSIKRYEQLMEDLPI